MRSRLPERSDTSVPAGWAGAGLTLPCRRAVTQNDPSRQYGLASHAGTGPVRIGLFHDEQALRVVHVVVAGRWVRRRPASRFRELSPRCSCTGGVASTLLEADQAPGCLALKVVVSSALAWRDVKPTASGRAHWMIWRSFLRRKTPAPGPSWMALRSHRWFTPQAAAAGGRDYSAVAVSARVEPRHRRAAGWWSVTAHTGSARR
jgi:hypothetical protein